MLVFCSSWLKWQQPIFSFLFFLMLCHSGLVCCRKALSVIWFPLAAVPYSKVLWRKWASLYLSDTQWYICWSLVTAAWRAGWRDAGPEHHCCRAQKSNECMVVFSLGLLHLAPALFIITNTKTLANRRINWLSAAKWTRILLVIKN